VNLLVKIINYVSFFRSLWYSYNYCQCCCQWCNDVIAIMTSSRCGQTDTRNDRKFVGHIVSFVHCVYLVELIKGCNIVNIYSLHNLQLSWFVTWCSGNIIGCINKVI